MCEHVFCMFNPYKGMNHRIYVCQTNNGVEILPRTLSHKICMWKCWANPLGIDGKSSTVGVWILNVVAEQQPVFCIEGFHDAVRTPCWIFLCVARYRKNPEKNNRICFNFSFYLSMSNSR